MRVRNLNDSEISNHNAIDNASSVKLKIARPYPKLEAELRHRPKEPTKHLCRDPLEAILAARFLPMPATAEQTIQTICQIGVFLEVPCCDCSFLLSSEVLIRLAIDYSV